MLNYNEGQSLALSRVWSWSKTSSVRMSKAGGVEHRLGRSAVTALDL
jgi:hypothetical protein